MKGTHSRLMSRGPGPAKPHSKPLNQLLRPLGGCVRLGAHLVEVDGGRRRGEVGSAEHEEEEFAVGYQSYFMHWFY